MKRNSLFILLIFFAFSCSNQINKEKKDEYCLSYFQSKYPEYYKDTISYFPYHVLIYDYDSLSKQEMLLFDSGNNYFEYVFYNISNNEPRYVMYFDSLLNVTKQEGKPVYIASPDFRQNHVKDTFEVNVYLATPPEFNYKFTVFYIDTLGISNELAEHLVVDDAFTKFIGIAKSFREKEEDYYIVSKIWNKNFERIDTTWFKISKEQY